VCALNLIILWGIEDLETSNGELVQNSAIRYFLGIHKYAPTLAIVGDMGWESSEAR